MTYWLALTLFGCNGADNLREPGEESTAWGSAPTQAFSVEDGRAAETSQQPISSVLTLAELPSFDAGTTVRVEASGATRSSAVFFLVGKPADAPVCPPLLGGLCLSIDGSDGRVVADAVAGASGTATADVDVPDSEFVHALIDSEQIVWMQAVQTSPPMVSLPVPINVCDSTRVCEDLITCVGDQLYPTTCGDNDCSTPVSDCSSDCKGLPIANGTCDTCLDSLCLSVTCDAGFAAETGTTDCEPVEPEAGGRCATGYGPEGVWVSREICQSDNATADSYGDTCASWGDWHVCDSFFDDDDFTLTEQCCACGGGTRESFLVCETPAGACPEVVFGEGHSVVEIPFVWASEPYLARNFRQGYRAATDDLCVRLPDNVRSVVATIQTEDGGNVPQFRSLHVGEDVVLGASTTDVGFDEPYSSLWDTYRSLGTPDTDSFGLPVNDASPSVGGQTLTITPSASRWEADRSVSLSGAFATLYLAANTTPSEEQSGTLTLNMMIDPSLLVDRELASSPDAGKLTAEQLDEVIRVASSYSESFQFELGVVEALPESLGDTSGVISSNDEFQAMIERLPEGASTESITVFLVETIFLEDTSSSYLGLSGGLPGAAVGGDVNLPSHGVAVAMDGHRLARAGFCELGFVPDCSGDGDCATRAWIGDGTCDGEDEAYGLDLSCYANDGGDCGPTTCPPGTLADCSGDGDCAPRGWLADGVCDGVDEPDGFDLSCYAEDGGDCILSGGLGVIDPEFLASTVGHEIGHYVGLRHTSNREGDMHDPIADTPKCLLDYTTLSADAYFGTLESPEGTCFYPSLNLMFWADNVMGYYPVSEVQGTVTRAHPLVQ